MQRSPGLQEDAVWWDGAGGGTGLGVGWGQWWDGAGGGMGLGVAFTPRMLILNQKVRGMQESCKFFKLAMVSSH